MVPDISIPSISVCVPVYNGAQYMDACLASIAAQTFTDFEVLIVDDCSSDDGMVIARRWAEADRRFQVHVNPKNLGLVGNWNRCLEISRGRWIKYLFQDDLMEVDCLEEMLAVAGTSEGFVACARKLIFEGEHEPALLQVYADHREVLQRIFGSGRRLSADEYSDVRLTVEGWNIVGEPSVTMIDRELFERFGPFDPMLIQFCDSEMWNRLATNVGVSYLGKELVSFRVHRGSVSEANRGREFRAKTLDQIIELKLLYSGPQYERFREYAKRAGRLRVLRRSLRHYVNAAFETARLAAAERPPNLLLKEELRKVLAPLPGYTASRVAYLAYRAKRLVSPTK